MRGILYGIGVGPGDPELITIKALRCMRESDVIILPSEPSEDCYAYSIAKAAFTEIDEKEIICMPFLMTKEKKELEDSHNKIYRNISELLDSGKNVAFLTIGDPSIYSTYSYIHRRVLAAGGNALMVSGVPSFCAAAAAIGISLGENKEEIHVIPGSYDIKETFNLNGTRIYMKSGKKLAELKNALREAGTERFLIYAVSNCGMENEKITSELEALSEDSGYLTVVMVKEKDGI
ncbi:precorrin-2/cobalt-factor-2 C20-methyltransferase [Kineothrix alysoides]|uniref:Precorrin-2/cobalt-factor-2 C20-methyltransferase n=1 Tax=Kineothrix alysoides TaxID=1469948 RepID=A0A4R1QV81_9FIRM|nr:precorrin-2 C(20)-methyltransferase [Kineothrix alysoides]TCL57477.1 precorrin-2/cobalt-factor-2 C20-methyltransferase [Kineothrix alysoides]